MSSVPEIIPYRPEHAASIRAMLVEIGWPEYLVEISTANAARYAKREQTAAVVALVGGAAVGFIYVEYFAWNNLAQVQGLAVHPALHRKGIGTALIRWAEAFARGKQARGIFVDTPVGNARGRAFYGAAGYDEAYFMPRYYDDDQDGVTFQHFFVP